MSIWWLKTLVLPYYFLINTRISGTVGKNTPSKEPHAFFPDEMKNDSKKSISKNGGKC